MDINTFWNSIDSKDKEPNECWPWLRSLDGDGYGQCWCNGKHWRTHRLSYLLWYHALEDRHLMQGKVVRHICDNPICCNPVHLVLGTHADNMRDMVGHGRQAHARGEYHGASKLTTEDVLQIRYDYQHTDTLQKDLAKKYNVSRELISRIVLRKTWTHI